MTTELTESSLTSTKCMGNVLANLRHILSTYIMLNIEIHIIS